jgi:predicted ester cyclase
MATVDNAAVIREMQEAWNHKDIDKAASFATPEARMTIVPFGATQSVREYEEGWARAFPDGHIQVTNMVAQGDCVMCEFTGSGTNTGPLRTPMGELPPTNRRAEMSFVEVYRMKNGKVAEGRLYFDAATMMNQLGISAGAGAQGQQRPGAQPSQQPRH